MVWALRLEQDKLLNDQKITRPFNLYILIDQVLEEIEEGLGMDHEDFVICSSIQVTDFSIKPAPAGYV